MAFLSSGARVPRRLIAAACVTLAACMPAWADTQNETAAPVSAVWTPKELRFTYMGFTSRYSCDGLRDKIRVALLKLGARNDLQIRETPCSGGLGRPTIFPGVYVKMNVLQPASGPTAQGDAADAKPVSAHWEKKDLATERDVVLQAGDCELLEQIKQSILPAFTTRNVEYHSTCVPHQLSIGATTLTAEVLVADQAPAATSSGGG